MNRAGQDGVLLLHGIARGAASLAKLERALRDEGYATLNLEYPSRGRSLADLAEAIHPEVAPFAARTPGALHLVTHSMGGLLARAYLARHRPARLGRVVMVGPPSGGSELADLFGGLRAYRAFFGPAGAELGTSRDEAARALLGRVDYPLGIVAGTRSADPLGWLLIPGPNDGRVSLARTRVEGMSDHATLPVTHALMMRDPRVIAHALHFLREGRFPR